MSHRKLDLVRAIYAASERGDYTSADWADPEIEFVSPIGVEAGTWTGLGAMAKAWRETLSAWQDVRTGADEYRVIDDDRVLALHSFSGRGKISGLEVGPDFTRGAALFHVRDGKVTRLVLSMNREGALADLDLAPDAGRPAAALRRPARARRCARARPRAGRSLRRSRRRAKAGRRRNKVRRSCGPANLEDGLLAPSPLLVRCLVG
jgi:ketosteroid isomerase-like protein